LGPDSSYVSAALATKSVIKTARDILDRFYREAEGRTNRQIDVFYTLEDMGFGKDKAEPAMEYLVSRGLVNSFGTDIAFLTDAGVKVVKEDADIGALPKAVRDFNVAPPSAAAPQETPARGGSGSGSTAPPAGRTRPKKPFLMHITAEGEEFALPLGWSCTIGRQDGNEVKVNDQRASKRHAEIFYKDKAYYLRDLNSANGTLLNGDYVVEEMLLKHDDEVVIGRTMILFQTPEVIPRPPGPSPEEQNASDEATVIPPAVEDAPLPPTERPSEAQAPDDPEPIRVVRGRPAPAKKPEVVRAAEMPTPAEDLFAAPERPTAKSKGKSQSQPDDLFAEPKTKKRSDDLFEAPSSKKRGDDDLFAAPSTKKSDDDLFAESKRDPDDDLFAKPKAEPEDLFAEEERPEPTPRPSSRAKTALEPKPTSDDIFGDRLPPRIDSSARLVAELTGEPPTTSPQEAEAIIEELEPLPLDAIEAPLQQVAAEAPGSWEEQTPTDGALENPPVATPDEEDKSEATVMTLRDQLYKTEDKPTEELPHWGEAPLPSASIEPGQSDKPGLHLYGEDMPDAAISLVNLKAVAREGSAEGLLDVEAFRRTLSALKSHAERADLPDRDEVIAALDLLHAHPYIRVALKLLS
jgi:pSer/pThr/pTyr-binding forkhead associated (FHA) protein